MPSLACKNRLSCSDVVSVDGSGVCELTNQSRLSRLLKRRALKRHEPKQSVSDRAGIQICSIGQYKIV